LQEHEIRSQVKMSSLKFLSGEIGHSYVHSA